MDYKKKYEEAMLRMNKWVEGSEIVDPKEVAEFVFPELAESEDERIKEVITKTLKRIPSREIECFGVTKDSVYAWLEKQGEKIDAIENLDTEFEKQVSHLIASAINKEHEYNQSYVKWTANALLNYAKHELEKQGEQNPTDKVEPKFKVGDWVTNGINFTFQVRSIEDNMYLRSDEYFIDIETADKTFRLWTIQDAKEGDVLCCENGWTCIFKSLDSNSFSSYCFMDCSEWFCELGGECHSLNKNLCGKIHPATKEQRDILFQRMKEAGYEWDAKKKELKKIEQKPVPITDEWTENYWKHKKVNNPYSYDKGDEIQFDHQDFIRFCKKYCKKHAWSEEDEEMFDAIIADIQFTQKAHIHDVNQIVYEREIDWLKTFKEKMKGE